MSKKSSTFASDLKNDNSTLQNYQMVHDQMVNDEDQSFLYLK